MGKLLETFRCATGVDRREQDSEHQARLIAERASATTSLVRPRRTSELQVAESNTLIRRQQIDSGRFLCRRAALIQAIPEDVMTFARTGLMLKRRSGFRLFTWT